MAWWTDRILPRLTHRALGRPEIAELRRQACAGLHGQVLEIGFGSGLNVAHYPGAVRMVHAVDPSDVGWELSAPVREGAPVPVTRTGLDGARLSEPDDSVDTALSTFTLCTISDPARALAEVCRVLRPGGRLHFVEHGLAPHPGVARWQHRLEPLQQLVAGGCHLTRDIPELLASAGLRITTLDQHYLAPASVSRPWGFCSVGTARLDS